MSSVVPNPLLQSIVNATRATFAARSASIMLYDEKARQLEFVAVNGEGADTLIGRRLPIGTGVAGWVAVAREPVAIEDVGSDPRFARGFAETTGFVPSGLMAAPLLIEDRLLGVLSVLDRPQQARFTLPETQLLAAFALQAAYSLELIGQAQSHAEDLERRDGVESLREAISRLDGPRREAAERLVQALVELVSPVEPTG